MTGSSTERRIDSLVPLFEKRLRTAFDIRHGEGRRAFYMLLYIFGIICSLMIVKPVASAMFLARYGAISLPAVFVLVSVFAAIVSVLYLRLLRRVHLVRMMVRTLQASVLSLILFWAVFVGFAGFDGLLFVFYVWVAIFGLITTSQFWLLANLIFNSREAKRLFGLIGAGAIAGAIAGGYLTNWLAPILGSEGLLLPCIGFQVMCMGLLRLIWRESRRTRRRDMLLPQKRALPAHGNPLRLVASSNYLTTLAVLTALSVIAAKLVEYQFGAVASAAIVDEDRLAAFFGFWLSNINVASLFFQLLLTRRLVGRLGPGSSLYILPLGILAGTLGLLVHPALWSSVLLKLADGSLKQSVNKAGLELLALLLPVESKTQAKSFIDIFVDSFATGLGGVLLFVLTSGFELPVRGIATVLLVILAVWLFMVKRVRLEYVKLIRDRIRVAPSEPQPGKRSVLETILRALNGADVNQIVRTLRMTRGSRSDQLVNVLVKLLRHPSPAVRLEALRNLYFYRNVYVLETVRELLEDPDLEIRAEALACLHRHDADGEPVILDSSLESEDEQMRFAALVCAAREARRNADLQARFRIRERIDLAMQRAGEPGNSAGQSAVRTACARAIGASGIPELHAYLHLLLRDASLEVRTAAIEAAGESGQYEFLPVLFDAWNQPETRESVRQALLRYGPSILDELGLRLRDPREPRELRLRIPEIMSEIGGQTSVDLLESALDGTSGALKDNIINALFKMRQAQPGLVFNPKRILGRILSEAYSYLDMLAVLRSQIDAKAARRTDGIQAREEKARTELVKVLEKRLDIRLVRIFHLLGLRYPPREMHQVQTGMRSSEADLRANALEYLDSLLEPDLRRLIIPILETAYVDAVADRIFSDLEIQLPDEFQGLAALLRTGDPEIVRRVLPLIRVRKDARYISHVAGLLKSPDEEVRRLAEQTMTAYQTAEPSGRES